jgi:hypothetical protein
LRSFRPSSSVCHAWIMAALAPDHCRHLDQGNLSLWAAGGQIFNDSTGHVNQQQRPLGFLSHERWAAANSDTIKTHSPEGVKQESFRRLVVARGEISTFSLFKILKEKVCRPIRQGKVLHNRSQCLLKNGKRTRRYPLGSIAHPAVPEAELRRVVMEARLGVPTLTGLSEALRKRQAVAINACEPCHPTAREALAPAP